MIRVELAREARRVRTLVWLAVVGALPVALTAALGLGVGPGEHVAGEGFMALATQSGLNMAVVSLEHAAILFLPIAVAVFAGSAVAEEASWGTLRYLLVRPVSRGRLLVAKLTVVAALVVAAAAVVTVASVAGGLVAFGGGALETPAGESIEAGPALGRLAVGAGYIAWGMAGVVGIAFFVSVTSSAPLNAVAAGFGTVIVSQVLDSFAALGDVRAVLPTHYWPAWEDLFLDPVPTDDLVAGVLVQVVYLVVFVGLAWWWFRRADVLT
jgi:ABC-2 type transport system permease protein